MRNPLLVPLLLVALGGCAANTDGDLVPQADVGGSAVRLGAVPGASAPVVIDTGHNDRVEQSAFAAAPDQVWAQLPAAFQALGLEVNSGSSRTRVLGVENLRLRRIAGSSPSRYLECGQGVTGPNANVYDVYLSLLAQVLPADDGGSRVDVRVNAIAQDRSTSGAPMACGSNGRLEVQFIETLQGLVDALER